MNKRIKLFSILLIFILLLNGCSAGNKDEEVKEVGQEELSDVKEDEEDTSELEDLVINLEGGDWGYPNPYAHYSRGPGSYKMKLIFDSLLEYDEDGLIPWIAKDWEVSDDGKEYTFILEDNVKWHDGEDLTAEDVAFTLDYFKEHPPVSDNLQRADKDFIENIDILNDREIKISVNEPRASLLEDLGTMRILPKHIWENIEDPNEYIEEDSVIGSGPFTLEDYSKEEGAYKFVAFENYWGPKQLVKELNFIPVSDNLLAFENGEIDLTSITPDLLDMYESNEEVELLENPAFWGYRLVFNMDARPELLDKDLRHGIAYAIDVDEIIEKVGRGAGKEASAGYLPIEHVDYNSDVEKYDFDIEKSKELLDGKNYEFTLLIGDSNPELKMAELIKMNLEEVGINLEIKSVDGKSRDAAMKEGDYELAITGHGGWGNDPNSLLMQYVNMGKGPGGIRGYNNDEINKLALDQHKEIDPEKRQKLVYELQELISEELPQIPIYNTVGYTVYRPEHYDGWTHIFNHHEVTHNKISYLDME